ncbi:MAG: DUF2911 domain-containing protein [Eudoraea sp.]|nr:DUF2911 domain-containing protein [Eudoraea sp.]MBT8210637.1 DUF2911 domain-containing protein [Eudoraea sp.]NNK30814.1 DUF2911 domain-containing protein [Flavobacteriaceae bacterium]
MSVRCQIIHPKASPYAEVVQYIGLTKVTVSYSRPGVKGRKIIGDLVPYGRIWRVGANESTKFSVDRAVEVKGNPLPKGTYALYAFPGKTEWEIVFHTNTAHWGDGRNAYDPKEDLFRIQIVPDSISQVQENFLIAFDSLTHNSAIMVWEWEHTRLQIPITVDTHKQMLEEINSKLNAQPTPQTYYEAARYLQEQEIQSDRAMEYIIKAIQLGGDTYYFYRVKSLLEASKGDHRAAIASARLSLKLAQLEEKDEFVRMNQKNIALWEANLKSIKQ